MKKFFLLMILLFLCTVLFAGPAEEIINAAAELVGTPYRYGGVTPSGFDCSGLLYYLYSDVVDPFPRRSSDQARSGSQVNSNELVPGDLVFYATGRNPSEITHAALFVGDNTVIQALSAGPRTGVVVTDMDESYWKNRFVTARRVLFPAVASEEGSRPNSDEDRTHVSAPAVKEKVIDDKGEEKTVVIIGRRKFIISSWEDWNKNDQAEFQEKQESDREAVEEDLSDFEKWKKANAPG